LRADHQADDGRPQVDNCCGVLPYAFGYHWDGPLGCTGYPFGTRYLLDISQNLVLTGLGKIISPSKFNFFQSKILNRLKMFCAELITYKVANLCSVFSIYLYLLFLVHVISADSHLIYVEVFVELLSRCIDNSA